MDKRTMARAFDEWTRRYVEAPEEFEAQFKTIERFKRQGGHKGKPTTDGDVCAAYLRKLMRGG
jgi:hypothetical protein